MRQVLTGFGLVAALVLACDARREAELVYAGEYWRITEPAPLDLEARCAEPRALEVAPGSLWEMKGEVAFRCPGDAQPAPVRFGGPAYALATAGEHLVLEPTRALGTWREVVTFGQWREWAPDDAPWGVAWEAWVGDGRVELAPRGAAGLPELGAWDVSFAGSPTEGPCMRARVVGTARGVQAAGVRHASCAVEGVVDFVPVQAVRRVGEVREGES